ncbi:hypothetical protein [Eisenibacter elegans]|jgi:hypothetical protein|uniref:hypothetical protein n=1 Tax=Eisenibacter elegans TaxID=997 RepID=UPI0012B52FA3|nr:hypothetical protein [Eisenibacter elegans]
MMVKKLITPIAFALLACGVWACGGSNSNNAQNTDSSSTEAVTENLKKILNEVPKPTEIPYLLEATGADFNAKIPNKAENVDKYKTTNTIAALNLGIYAADIGYVSVYEKVQDALDYMNAVKTLSDKLGLSNVFEASTIERFKQNLDNKDSLATIIDESIKSADEYLKDNERNNISSYIFAGSFIEGLYIATALVDNYPKDILPADVRDQILIPIVRLIIKQDEPLANLIDVLESLGEQDATVQKLLADLKELKESYAKLDIEERIKNNEGDLVINDETIKQITAKVKQIRSGLVG